MLRHRAPWTLRNVFVGSGQSLEDPSYLTVLGQIFAYLGFLEDLLNDP